MKAGSIGTYLHLVCIEPGEKPEAGREASAIDWAEPVRTLEDQDRSDSLSLAERLLDTTRAHDELY